MHNRKLALTFMAITGTTALLAQNNVGIGTTAPQQTLHLNSNLVSTGLLMTTDNTGTTITDGFLIGIRYQQDEQPANSYNFLWGHENIPTYFYTHNLLRMQISAAGNVGIGGFFEPTALLHTRGTGTGQGNVLFEGQSKGNPGNPPVTGPGTRMMWYPDKGAFRVGGVTGTEWNKDSIGYTSIAMGYNAKALGEEAFAFGTGIRAAGNNSIVLGQFSEATAQTSITIGNSSFARGTFSFAIGSGVQANGHGSMALGWSNIAPSAFETVLGRFGTLYTPLSTDQFNNADRLLVVGNGANISNRSDALVIMKHGGIGLGISNPAAFSNLHLHNKNADQVFQRFTNSVTGTDFTDGLRIGIRDNTHNGQIWNFENGRLLFGTNNIERMTISNTGNVGIGTTTPKARLHVVDSMVLFEGPFFVSNPPPNFVDPGRGAFMMWIPQHAAFRAGYNNLDAWAPANTGRFSFAAGSTTTASGNTSTAFGEATEASGSISFAMGNRTKAIGQFSTSIGWLSNASGMSSFAAGISTLADSYGSTAIGRWNVGGGNAESWITSEAVFEVGNGSSTNRNNALTVLKNGKVGTGGMNKPEAALHVLHPNVSAEGIRIQNSGSNNRHWTLHTNNAGGTLILYSSIGGATPIGNFNGSTGAYTATSNRHLKTNVQLLDADVLTRIQQLQPSSYSYIRDPQGHRTVGFMAEDVQPIFPELVETIGETGENMAINYAGFSVVAIKAIQLLEEKQQTLEKELAAKEKRITTLENDLQEMKQLLNKTNKNE